MKKFDKADWQIDGGMDPDTVVSHFQRIFSWLDAKGFLTEEGKEVLEFGIDTSVSLHERLITREAFEFLDAAYDDYLKCNPYTEDGDSSILEKMFTDYKKKIM
jgi:hypothetical protein